MVWGTGLEDARMALTILISMTHCSVHEVKVSLIPDDDDGGDGDGGGTGRDFGGGAGRSVLLSLRWG